MDLLTSDEVLKAIEQFSKTPQGKAEIKEQMGDRTRDFVPKYLNKNEIFRRISQARHAAEDMADILYKHIINDTVTTYTDENGVSHQRIGLSNFKREDIIVGRTYKVGPDQYACDISFNKEALHRDSLLPKYFDGIDDIISLFVHGYSAKNSVYGTWHTSNGTEVDTYSRRRCEPNSFMVNAINEFNAKYGKKAVATIKPEYQS